MIRSYFRKQSGQTLVWVAVGMTVLLLFAALAIEVGHWYSERRKMQNSADAGALAGAYEICFGTESNWNVRAMEYATRPRNWGEPYPKTEAKRSGDIVNVVAGESVTPFFAGIIGIPSVDISAEAEAACGGARNLCGVWPITFQASRWNEMPKCPDNDNVPFIVWNDKAFEETAPKYTDAAGKKYYLCDVCDCQNIPAFGPPDHRYFLIGPGERGWVNLPEPEPPYEAMSCTKPCGSSSSVCVINAPGGYTGLLEPPLCLPSKSGVANDIPIAVEDNLHKKINILLWDRPCGDDEPVAGTCPGTPAYHISKTGCAEATDVLTVELPLKTEFSSIPGSASWCPNNVKAILMTKQCDCDAECGSTAGGPCEDGEVCAVSLTK